MIKIKKFTFNPVGVNAYLLWDETLEAVLIDPACFFGDGYLGLPTYGPFDKIIVTAGADSVPVKLKEQLAVGGRMVIPVGGREHQVMKIIIRESETGYSEQEAGYFVFVPLLPGVSDQNHES